MWSFVVQNSYDLFLHRTRRGISLKKLSVSNKVSLLLKNLLTNFDKKTSMSLNSYYFIYLIYLKRDVWNTYKQLVNYNEGLIANNLTKSYAYFSSNALIKASPNYTAKFIPTRTILKEFNVVKLPLSKSTFNSFLWANYLTILNLYLVYPKQLKFVFQYNWVSKEYFFDGMLNLFYYKIYKY
jgi:hypothetical protein